MNENNKTCLGNHCWLLGTDVWQIQALKKLLPQNDKLDKIIQIAQILGKYQKEINYYQARIRATLTELAKNK